MACLTLLKEVSRLFVWTPCAAVLKVKEQNGARILPLNCCGTAQQTSGFQKSYSVIVSSTVKTVKCSRISYKDFFITQNTFITGK